MWQKGRVRIDKTSRYVDLWVKAQPPECALVVMAYSGRPSVTTHYILAVAGPAHAPHADVVLSSDMVELLPEFQEDVPMEPYAEYHDRVIKERILAMAEVLSAQGPKGEE